MNCSASGKRLLAAPKNRWALDERFWKPKDRQTAALGLVRLAPARSKPVTIHAAAHDFSHPL